MIVIVGFLTIVIVGTILPFCLYLAAVKIRRKCICRIIIKRGAGSGNDRGGDLFRNCIPGNRYSEICTGIIYTFSF